MVEVQQLTPYTCGLACLEAVTTELGSPVTESEVLRKYRRDLLRFITRNGTAMGEHTKFGCVSPPLVAAILKDLGFVVEEQKASCMQPDEVRHFLEAGSPVIMSAHLQKQAHHSFVFDRFINDHTVNVMDPGFFSHTRNATHLLTELISWDLEMLRVSKPIP